uniref:Uncharacterized protein n=1 Tax=Oryza barthii TaxID=65489 RepID=A0A0D3GWF7_9ORYZ
MMKKTSKELDYVLVPMGMAVMVAYHAWLLLRIRRRPATTVIGINAINRRIWVRHVMEEAYFWSLGVRAFYFSCPVFLWLFGPIPMFASCLAMVCALYFLDVYTEWDEKPEEEEELNGNGDGDDGGAAACHEQPKMAAGNRVTPQQDVLDYVLVPMGMAVMVAYHAWLLLRIRRRPATTVIGINAINRRIWVRHVMEEPSGKHAVLAVQTMRNSIMASTVLASVAITLSSLRRRPRHLLSSGHAVVGGGVAGEAELSVKFFAILVCFLLAFLLNVQSIRYYSHTGLLVNVPLHAHRHRRRRPGLAVDYVTATLNRGSYFWSLGVRAFYFSCPVFLWLFGPIPMFAACLAMVCALYFLDVYT